VTSKSKDKSLSSSQQESIASAIVNAEIVLSVVDVTADLSFYTDKLGFRLEQIFPADDPASVLLLGHGLRLRLQRSDEPVASVLRLFVKDHALLATLQNPLFTPSGTVIEFSLADPPLEIPPTQHSFVVRRLADQAPWVIGRAGMHYRDLIPDRLGGSIIASHIRIPDGGPVPDMVHYHIVGFQLIYCHKGWVDVVYEDQGPPIRLTPGDCVIQPPQIRHRVLESSDQLEVIEIGVPAEHITTIDHTMQLPNSDYRPERKFNDQTFVHHRVADATWSPWRIAGFEHRDTGISAATAGVANVQVARLASSQSAVRDSPMVSHDSDILFSFVLSGGMSVTTDGQSYQLSAGDAFVLPPEQNARYGAYTPDLELLEVSLPGSFKTYVHKT